MLMDANYEKYCWKLMFFIFCFVFFWLLICCGQFCKNQTPWRITNSASRNAKLNKTNGFQFEWDKVWSEQTDRQTDRQTRIRDRSYLLVPLRMSESTTLLLTINLIVCERKFAFDYWLFKAERMQLCKCCSWYVVFVFIDWPIVTIFMNSVMKGQKRNLLEYVLKSRQTELKPVAEVKNQRFTR